MEHSRASLIRSLESEDRYVYEMHKRRHAQPSRNVVLDSTYDTIVSLELEAFRTVRSILQHRDSGDMRLTLQNAKEPSRPGEATTVATDANSAEATPPRANAGDSGALASPVTPKPRTGVRRFPIPKMRVAPMCKKLLTFGKVPPGARPPTGLNSVAPTSPPVAVSPEHPQRASTRPHESATEDSESANSSESNASESSDATADSPILSPVATVAGDPARPPSVRLAEAELSQMIPDVSDKANPCDSTPKGAVTVVPSEAELPPPLDPSLSLSSIVPSQVGNHEVNIMADATATSRSFSKSLFSTLPQESQRSMSSGTPKPPCSLLDVTPTSSESEPLTSATPSVASPASTVFSNSSPLNASSSELSSPSSIADSLSSAGTPASVTSSVERASLFSGTANATAGTSPATSVIFSPSRFSFGRASNKGDPCATPTLLSQPSSPSATDVTFASPTAARGAANFDYPDNNELVTPLAAVGPSLSKHFSRPFDASFGVNSDSFNPSHPSFMASDVAQAAAAASLSAVTRALSAQFPAPSSSVASHRSKHSFPGPEEMTTETAAPTLDPPSDSGFPGLAVASARSVSSVGSPVQESTIEASSNTAESIGSSVYEEPIEVPTGNDKSAPLVFPRGGTYSPSDEPIANATEGGETYAIAESVKTITPRRAATDGNFAPVVESTLMAADAVISSVEEAHGSSTNKLVDTSDDADGSVDVGTPVGGDNGADETDRHGEEDVSQVGPVTLTLPSLSSDGFSAHSANVAESPYRAVCADIDAAHSAVKTEDTGTAEDTSPGNGNTDIRSRETLDDTVARPSLVSHVNPEVDSSSPSSSARATSDSPASSDGAKCDASLEVHHVSDSDTVGGFDGRDDISTPGAGSSGAMTDLPHHDVSDVDTTPRLEQAQSLGNSEVVSAANVACDSSSTVDDASPSIVTEESPAMDATPQTPVEDVSPSTATEVSSSSVDDASPSIVTEESPAMDATPQTPVEDVSPSTATEVSSSSVDDASPSIVTEESPAMDATPQTPVEDVSPSTATEVSSSSVDDASPSIVTEESPAMDATPQTPVEDVSPSTATEVSSSSVDDASPSIVTEESPAMDATPQTPVEDVSPSTATEVSSSSVDDASPSIVTEESPAMDATPQTPVEDVSPSTATEVSSSSVDDASPSIVTEESPAMDATPQTPVEDVSPSTATEVSSSSVDDASPSIVTEESPAMDATPQTPVEDVSPSTATEVSSSSVDDASPSIVTEESPAMDATPQTPVEDVSPSTATEVSSSSVDDASPSIVTEESPAMDATPQTPVEDVSPSTATEVSSSSVDDASPSIVTEESQPMDATPQSIATDESPLNQDYESSSNADTESQSFSEDEVASAAETVDTVQSPHASNAGSDAHTNSATPTPTSAASSSVEDDVDESPMTAEESGVHSSANLSVDASPATSLGASTASVTPRSEVTPRLESDYPSEPLSASSDEGTASASGTDQSETADHTAVRPRKAPLKMRTRWAPTADIPDLSAPATPRSATSVDNDNSVMATDGGATDSHVSDMLSDSDTPTAVHSPLSAAVAAAKAYHEADEASDDSSSVSSVMAGSAADPNSALQAGDASGRLVRVRLANLVDVKLLRRHLRPGGAATVEPKRVNLVHVGVARLLTLDDVVSAVLPSHHVRQPLIRQLVEDRRPQLHRNLPLPLLAVGLHHLPLPLGVLPVPSQQNPNLFQHRRLHVLQNVAHTGAEGVLEEALVELEEDPDHVLQVAVSVRVERVVRARGHYPVQVAELGDVRVEEVVVLRFDHLVVGHVRPHVRTVVERHDEARVQIRVEPRHRLLQVPLAGARPRHDAVHEEGPVRVQNRNHHVRVLLGGVCVDGELVVEREHLEEAAQAGPQLHVVPDVGEVGHGELEELWLAQFIYKVRQLDVQHVQFGLRARVEQRVVEIQQQHQLAVFDRPRLEARPHLRGEAPRLGLGLYAEGREHFDLVQLVVPPVALRGRGDERVGERDVDGRGGAIAAVAGCLFSAVIAAPVVLV
ncbi:uncharacterized protein BcabD6B2_53540 [Babesia caballi]|uniref:Uncharacterized protein n=1 Tax=Babesia caballi TaxID=5871 RepID=A0AAV4M0P5_BABCB|nr:hypothetical protein, conserved [Babesia caballi]